MMGLSDIRDRMKPAAQPRDAPDMAEDIARLNKEWREKRDSFRSSKKNAEPPANQLTPDAAAPAIRPAIPAPAAAETRRVAPVSDNGLAEAAAGGRLEDCRRILTFGGAEIANTCGPDGTTPLCAAASWDNADVLRLLLEAAADPRQPNRSGRQPTALHTAAEQENGKICMLLLEARADPQMKDGAGVTPSDHASCSEAVWPIFATSGCSRTSKEELIRKGVIRKASSALEHELEAPSTDGDGIALNTDDGQTTSGVLREFSRPGSAYVLASKHPPRPGSAAGVVRPSSSSRQGRRPSGGPIDILAEGDETAEAMETPSTRPSTGYTGGAPPLPPSCKTPSGNAAAPSSLRSLGL